MEFRARTRKVISPGLSIFNPCSNVMSLHPGDIMLETLTRLRCCIFASLRANSKDCNCSLCLPTPFVRKKYFGIILQ